MRTPTGWPSNRRLRKEAEHRHRSDPASCGSGEPWTKEISRDDTSPTSAATFCHMPARTQGGRHPVGRHPPHGRGRGLQWRRRQRWRRDSAAPTSPPGCAEATALEESVTALTEVSPVNDGLDALKSAVTEVQTDLDATLSAVSSELKPSVDQVEASFDDLRSILEGISDADGLGAAATEVGAGLSQVGRALTGLSDAIDQDC